MTEFWVYTALRVGLFLAVLAVLAGAWLLAYNIDATSVVVLVIVAALVSSLASVRLLRGPRRALATRVEQRASRMASRLADVRAKEDVD
ncbi:MAG: DUF4229 domain-containing protein [Actinomycetota bacterium]|nr:DUF4229 domain-containing protein [Actinomycetota bacterium]